MTENLSEVDRWIRLLAGGAASWEFYLLPAQRWWLPLFIFFFMLTGLIGSCPLYKLAGTGTK